MHWILQENLFKESEWETLTATLARFNLPYSVHKVIPFIGELTPPAEPTQPKVICFGSYSMRHSAKAFNWTPGVYDLEPCNFTVQLEHWGDLMLNADSVVAPFHAVNITEPTFMRPIDDSKYFAGKVFDVDEFYEWKRNVCVLEHDYGNSMTKDTLIQACAPKVIYAEYRFWIVDAKIVTCSLYKRGSRVTYSSEVDEAVKRFAHQVVRHGDITLAMRTSAWQPHRAYVLDVCETPDGFKIVEINTLNSAGFYACDVQKLVVALEELEA